MLDGESIQIFSPELSDHQANIARWICGHWATILTQCHAFVEVERATYELQAKELNRPSVFIGEGDDWSVYFTTEHEHDKTVGVDFERDIPVALTIGD
ncbi:hypothetical protein LP420_12530 [Massilia sp. B-10]|nr:hypothetical protein LP420_12530 [Massilia sp. B-10]